MRIRYNISYVNKDGHRVLYGANQGRLFWDDSEMAKGWLKSLDQFQKERLVDICGPQSQDTFQVSEFVCYDNGDAMSIYPKG